MSNFNTLPFELIVKILQLPFIDHKDILNLCNTQTKFLKLQNYSQLWLIKFFQRWPKLLKQIKHEINEENWFELYKLRYKYSKLVHNAVYDISWNQYYKKDISSTSFSDFNYLMNLSIHGMEFTIDELHDVLYPELPNRYQDLTLKFYAEICLAFVSQCRTRLALDKFFEDPLSHPDLENGVILFSQWHIPCSDCEAFNVPAMFDEWAGMTMFEFSSKQEVKDNLQTFLTSNSQHSLDLLATLSNVLFQKIGLKGNCDHDQWMQNSFITQVVERKMGLPITLSVIYKLIAQRLGLDCDLLDFPRRVILRFVTPVPDQPEFSADGVNKLQTTYFIDPFDGGKLMNFSQLQMAPYVDHVLTAEDFKVSDTKLILQRMARNLIANLYSHPEDRKTFRCFRYAVEFSLIMEPGDFEMRFLLLKLYLFLGVEFHKVLENLEQLMSRGLHASLCRTLMAEAKSKMEADANRQMEIFHRSDPNNSGVTFSVGMIMMHKKYNYTCVIIGWDPVCQATEDWKRQMGVCNLLGNGKFQPFYHVLVNDGTNRYAAQQNLTFAPAPSFVEHPDIGMFFDEYAGSHFVPNRRKSAEYPEDAAHTTETIRTKYSPVDMQTRVYSLIDRIIDDMI